MKIGANNILPAQNMVKQTNFTLRQATASELQKSKGSPATSWDRNSMNFHGSIGGADFDYTREDAIQSAWNNETGFNLFDKLSGKGGNIALGVSKPTADFISKLEKDGLSTSLDWLSKEMNFKNLSADALKQSIDFLSSQYAVMKEHINKNFTGEELNNQLDKLNETVTTYKNSIADAFADKVGGFLEENGVVGEKEKIYQSVINEFDTKVKEYDKFIQSNTDYAGINGTKDEWLKNDTNYMASELRKAISSSSYTNTSIKEGYSLDELQAVGDMVDEIKGYGFGVDNRSKTVTGSEEEIGLNLAELALKTQVFNKNANVSDSLKDALLKGVNSFINNTIDEIDAEYKRKSDESVISADKKGYATLDKNAINAVIDKVMSSYEMTGNASTAMKDGAVFAVDKFNSKREDGGEIYRYQGNVFKDFYNTSTTSKNTAGSLNSVTYYQEKSELENLINSFNSFVDKFSFGKGNYINKSEFSALA